MILADIGVETSCKAVEQLRTVVKERKLRTAEEIHDALKDILADMLNVGDTSLKLGTRPSVVLVIGVNGVGKTTTSANLGVGLVRDTISPLLGAAPDPELIDYIEKKALSYPGVLGIHDLMVHDYGPGSKLVSFHIELSADSDVMKSHDLIDSIERDFQVHDHLLVTIHFDPVVTDDPHINELRKFLSLIHISEPTRH